MGEDHKYARLVALFASLFVALAAGTPYLYGVYSPQLIQRVGLSTSDAATISVAVNLGSGLGGLPAGLLIDRLGPQVSILLGSVCIFCGYYSLNRIYIHAFSNIYLICVLMALVGFGSVTSFYSCLKAAQSNFPNHRGSAGAIPVGAYGLSATIFSIVGARLFSGDAGGLLAFLSYVCGSVAFLGSFLVHVFATQVTEDTALTSEPPTLKRSDSPSGSFSFWGVGRGNSSSSLSLYQRDFTSLVNTRDQIHKSGQEDSTESIPSSNAVARQISSSNENSMLLPSTKIPRISSSAELTGIEVMQPPVTIRYFLGNKNYLSHFLIVSLCSGICQMYIYTVGFIVRAQFTFKSHEGSAAEMQAIQVSTISIASFGGRVVSGVVSDFIHKNWRVQRQWVILGTILFTFIGQLLLVVTNSIESITLVSLCVGGAYGILNGSYPAIIADEFGTTSFSTAWGLINSGPVFLLFTLEKYFGYIYDGHSDRNGTCNLGNACYKGAFETSCILCILTAICTGLMIYGRRNMEFRMNGSRLS
ncbi:MFS general substrate transporter [Metschnikowia bicuspidata var. bicuspidata NRRL YB-4993]|uniref:MFS general substrate transporter n=1 Tax=Metschnikowia bicuspidata var. bicuspidata NRRL YB-4993 TaxID=869754 RepID=A0A1A0HHP7_9ASCO|nr:MFS general substrate transporter [Metschnikowia bicuspidata var. bicuspidata NRRL YB-4993]OBA23368.1 MFS general substrate transporter [Metschnikowia bicuspidata var. bicuspidata NRRL YB-4993]